MLKELLRQGVTIKQDDRWLDIDNGQIIVKQLKAGTTHKDWLQNGPAILYRGQDENTACEILING